LNERTWRSPSSPSASTSVSAFLAGFFSALGVTVFFPPLSSLLAVATGAFLTPNLVVAVTSTLERGVEVFFPPFCKVASTLARTGSASTLVAVSFLPFF